MNSSKRIWLVLAVLIIIVPMLASCIQFKFTGTIPELSSEPEPSVSEEAPSPTPYPSFSVPDASSNKPAYDGTGRPRYDIKVTFNETDHSAAASQTVNYTNTSAESMSELYMHIYPNHFSKQEYVEMRYTSPKETVYPDDVFDPGYIKIDSVKAAGKAAKFEVQGEDETVLRIPLDAPLKKGSSIDLSLEYSLKAPHRFGRFAWGETGTTFGNWYPIMAVYDGDGWNLDKYYEIGDPFYSETADYTVTIDMPEGMQAAFTGDVISDVTAGGRRVLSLSETGVRDFAFVLSSSYAIETETVDGVEIRAAVPKKNEESADDVLGYAKKALTLYNSRFGRYTNDALTVAFSDFYGGMEYPGLVLIQASLLDDEEGSLFIAEEVIAHEIGHQWWYSAVGNDEVDEAWMDEGLTSFTEMVYYSEEFGWEAVNTFFPETKFEEGKALDSSLAAFSGWDDYIYVYTFGRSFFKTLMDKMGGEEFFTMLQKYYASYAYGIATADGLRSLIAETGNTDALDWYDQGVYAK